MCSPTPPPPRPSSSPTPPLLSLCQCFYMCGPLLHTVIISNCAMVTDMAISQLAKKCERLRVLDMSKCRALTGRSLQALAQVIHTSSNRRYPSANNIRTGAKNIRTVLIILELVLIIVELVLLILELVLIILELVLLILERC